MIKYLSILHMAKNVLRKQFGNMYGKNKPFEVEETPKPKLPTMEPPTFTMKGIILFTLIIFLCMLLYLNRDEIWKFLGKAYTDFKPKDKLDELEEAYTELTQTSKLLNNFTGHLEKKEAREQKESFDTMPQHTAQIDQSKVNDTTQKTVHMEPNHPTLAANTIVEIQPTPTEPVRNETVPIRSIEQKEKEKKQLEKQVKNGGIHQIDEKLSLYGKHQIANYNGACYIGYDNKRECTNVYEGDICLSGQIFPTMEICVNP